MSRLDFKIAPKAPPSAKLFAMTPNHQSHFDHVAILGVGLLGASLGLALKQHRLAGRITGVGRKTSNSLQIARDRGAIDESSHDATQAAQTADLIVLCTPVRQFPHLLREIAPHLKPGAIITDVGSTKAHVMQWAEEILPPIEHQPARFVGSHPMAGSEKRGPEAAKPDLYKGAMCLLCEARGDAGSHSIKKVESLWRALGMHTLRLTPEVHDQWVATISHLPHAVAFSLMNAAASHPEMLEAAAGGFIDTTRVASSDVEMWTDIFLTNRDAVIEAITKFEERIAGLKTAIKNGDEHTLRTALLAAKHARDELLRRRHERQQQRSAE